MRAIACAFLLLTLAACAPAPLTAEPETAPNLPAQPANPSPYDLSVPVVAWNQSIAASCDPGTASLFRLNLSLSSTHRCPVSTFRNWLNYNFRR